MFENAAARTRRIGLLGKSLPLRLYGTARSFCMATGKAPMTDLRARRLSVATSALAYGEDDIVNIAYTAQYNSPEALQPRRVPVPVSTTTPD